jgi:hypothetical protein
MTTKQMLLYVCDIINHGLDLDDGQVFVYNQKWTIPTDLKTYVSVGILSQKIFGNKLDYIYTSGGVQEELSVNCHATLSIDVYGKDIQALDDAALLMMALRSTYSQQKQNEHGFYIAQQPIAMTNVNEEEGSSLLYRQSISLVVQYYKIKENDVDYYDSFTKEIYTEE